MASASCSIEGAMAAEEGVPARDGLRQLNMGNENKEPVDYLLTVEYKPFDRQDHDTFSAEQMKKYNEAADFFDELRLMLAESQKKLREECGYVVDN